MCGIAGWYRRESRPVDVSIIRRQCDQIIHRGPDDAGDLVDRDFGFGMRRLSIIDVAGGHQPITSEDGRHSIVFNGEIYNHLVLRRDLAGSGVRFTTNSDTETLLQAYRTWGDAAWLRLEGMYAVAIWDRADRSLTLARDPLGIKPLFYSEQNGGLAFASEIRALEPLPEHDFDLDEQAVHDFFSFGHVQRPRTIYRQVRSLQPGHILRIGATALAQTKIFWEPRFRPVAGRSEEQWIEETRERVEQTVQQHTMADVPVGVFLSGGVDSSAIAASMARSADRRIKAFTVSFPGTSVDEAGAARRIAEHLGLEHIVLPLEPVHAGDLLPAVQSAFDEPCAATAAVPIWHVSRLAAQHVKVVLGGEGADEIFAGYKRQRTALAAARWAPFVRALPLGRSDATIPGLPSGLSYLMQNARRFRDTALLDGPLQRFFAGTQITSPATRQRLLEAGVFKRQERPDFLDQLKREYFGRKDLSELNPLQQFLLADITIHMPASLLNRLDKASMAHSLEARVPFLSHSFVDWSLTVPDQMKLRGRIGKYALREAIKPWLPVGALSNRKRGFQLPFAEWFRGDFADFALGAWHDSRAVESGYLRTAAVDDLFREHKLGRANHGRILYAIAMFSCWWENHRKREGAVGAAQC